MAKLRILYNDESTTDSDGIPAYNTEFLVVPDDGTDDTTFNALVAEKILEVKVPGAPLNGSTTVQVDDYYGETKTVRFTRPTKVMCQFYAKITANPATGVIDVSNVPVETQAIIDYVQSVDVGEAISWSRILGMLAADTGFVISEWGLRKGTSGAWVNTDIAPASVREYLWIDADNIDISTDAPEALE